MIKYKVYSWQFNNCQEYNEEFFRVILEAKTETINQAIQEIGTSYVERLLNRTIQKMWQTQLPMHYRERPWPKLLFIGQYAWCTTNNDLHLNGYKSNSRKSNRKFSKRTQDKRRNKQYKQRIIVKKKNILIHLWHPKWKKPP